MLLSSYLSSWLITCTISILILNNKIKGTNNQHYFPPILYPALSDHHSVINDTLSIRCKTLISIFFTCTVPIMLFIAEKWRVPLKGEMPDYIHATFIDVSHCNCCQ